MNARYEYAYLMRFFSHFYLKNRMDIACIRRACIASAISLHVQVSRLGLPS
jgi:hypothetical protein